MSADTLATITEAGILILAGVGMFLVGCRVIGRSPGESPAYDEWYERHGSKLKVTGLGLVVCVACQHLIRFLSR